MDAVFKAIPSASLAAEHGFFFKLGSFPGVRRTIAAHWQQLIKDFDLSWKEVAASPPPPSHPIPSHPIPSHPVKDFDLSWMEGAHGDNSKRIARTCRATAARPPRGRHAIAAGDDGDS